MSADATNRTLGELADEYGRADRLTEVAAMDAEPVTTDSDTDGNSETLTLNACPAADCDREFGSEKEVRRHLAAVEPAHYGLGDGYRPIDALSPEEIPGGGGQ